MHFTDTIAPSRRVRLAPVALALLLVAGCADVRLPSIVLDDGPAPAAAGAVTDTDPQKALTGERSIRRADAAAAPFPNLAAVPDRPTQFSSPVRQQEMLERLQTDKAEGRAEADAVRTEPTDGSAPSPGGPLAIPDAPPPAPEPIRR